MENSEPALRQIAGFLGQSDKKERPDEFFENIEYHKKESINAYSGYNSFAKASMEKLKYHSEKTLATLKNLQFDDYYKNDPELFDKYLKRYGLGMKLESTSQNRIMYRRTLISLACALVKSLTQI